MTEFCECRDWKETVTMDKDIHVQVIDGCEIRCIDCGNKLRIP